MKLTHFFKSLVALAVGLNFYVAFSASAIAKEVKLDPEFSKKCGITFRHPDTMRFYLVETDDPYRICVLAYRFKNLWPRPPSPIATAEGWKELSDGGFEIKPIPVDRQLEEFSFEKRDGVVYYKGQPSTESSITMGYSDETIEPIQIINKGGSNLYIGHAAVTQTDVKTGEKIYLRRIDLLFGNKERSVGQIIWESSDQTFSRGHIKIFEKIFKSMRFN